MRTRRRFLVAGASASLLLFAGCADDDGDDSAAGGDANTDDLSGDADEQENQRAGNEQTDEPTEQTNGDDSETEADGTSGEEQAESFDDLVTFRDAFAFELREEEQGTLWEGRFDGENSYFRFSGNGEEIEGYTVDGTDYVVVDGQCMIAPETDTVAPVATPFAPMNPQGVKHDLPDEVSREGTETIDGDRVIRFEVDSVSGSLRYYLLEDSGLLRRIEWEDADSSGTLEYQYENVEPVDSPEMECEEFPEENGI